MPRSEAGRALVPRSEAGRALVPQSGTLVPQSEAGRALVPQSEAGHLLCERCRAVGGRWRLRTLGQVQTVATEHLQLLSAGHVLQRPLT